MTVIDLSYVPGLALRVLGAGFLVANLHLVYQFIRFYRLRATALVTWPGRRPAYYGFFLGLGVVFGILVFVELII